MKLLALAITLLFSVSAYSAEITAQFTASTVAPIKVPTEYQLLMDGVVKCVASPEDVGPVDGTYYMDCEDIVAGTYVVSIAVLYEDGTQNEESNGIEITVYPESGPMVLEKVTVKYSNGVAQEFEAQ